jgi:hypothetical protein
MDEVARHERRAEQSAALGERPEVRGGAGRFPARHADLKRVADLRPMPTARSIFSDIRLWVLIFAVVRLVGITDPPLEVAQNWRQTTVLMVARNYYEIGPDLLHPRVDFAGEKTGITGMEFPLLNYLTYCVARVFGWADWYGRVIVLLSSMLGALAFHGLVARYLGKRRALIATLLLMSSLWFQYGRKTMPDVFALSLVMVGLWCMMRALDDGRWPLFPVAFLLLALGVLCKSPSVVLFAALGPVWWLARAKRGRLFLSMALAALALVPSVWWYGTWVPRLVRTYGFWHFFMGEDPGRGFSELLARWPEVAEKFYFDALRFTGFAAFLWGVCTVVRARARVFLAMLGLFGLALAGIMLKSGATFAAHSYYILPFVPVMAVVAAYGLDKLRSPGWAWLFTAVIVVEGLANAQHDLHLRADQKELLTLEPLLDRVSRRGDRIVINTGQVPTAMYFAHRKGWLAHDRDLRRPAFIDSLNALGCRYIVVLKDKGEGDVAIARPVVAETEHFRVLRTATE